jgi:hypothetical protein
MTDHDEMRRAVAHASHGDCSCGLQQRIDEFRWGMNIEDWTPIMTDLFARIEQLESALDEVGNALVSIVGDNTNDWDVKHRVEGTDVLLDLACETYENARKVE